MSCLLQSFAPINLDMSLTPEAFRQYLSNKEYLKATIGSLKINQYEVINDIVLSCPPNKIEGIVKYLDEYLIENLKLTISQMLDNSTYHITAIKWLKYIVFYFRFSKILRFEVYNFRKNVDAVLRLERLNRSMLLNI